MVVRKLLRVVHLRNRLDLRNRFEHGASDGSGEVSGFTGPGGSGEESAEKSP